MDWWSVTLAVAVVAEAVIAAAPADAQERCAVPAAAVWTSQRRRCGGSYALASGPT